MDEYSPRSLSANIPFGMNQQAVDPNFSKWNLNSQDVVEILEHCLRGEVWDANKKEWAIRGKSKMNELGIQALIAEINGRVNKIVIMSNLDEKSVNNWLWDLSHDLASELFLRFSDWGIEYSNLDPIHDLIILLSEAALRRAVMDGERKKIYEGQRTQENIIRNIDNKSGFFSWIPGMGGNR